MPPGRKPSHFRGEFIEAAIAYADQHGIEALTLRALGRAMGVSSTALYRYFPDKGDLIIGMRESLLAQAFSDAATVVGPLEALREMALAYRRVAREHPCLSQIMLMQVGEGATSLSVPTLGADLLGALGLRGHDVAVAYRQLETFVVGSSAFDFAGAPSHLDQRLDRLNATVNAHITLSLTSTAAVDVINEQAFAATLDTLLDSFVTRASATAPDSVDASLPS